MKSAKNVKAVLLIITMAVLIVMTFASTVFADSNTKDGYKYTTETISGKEVAVITGRSKPIETMKIPSKIGSYTVTKIDGYAFSGDKSIKKLVIPDTVIEVGDCAFRDCSNITSIKIGSKVQKIGMYGFSSTAITSITFPNSVTQMGESVLGGCTKCKKITLSKNIKSIPTFFCTSAAIPEIYIPEGVTSINSAAFYGCKQLQRVQCPSTLQVIYDSAFYECTGLKLVKLPKGLGSIGQSAFYGCTGMTLITLPAGLTSLGPRTFEGCTSLKSYICKSTGSKTFIYNEKTMGYDRNGNKVSGVVIYGAAASNYETYANDNGFTFKALSKAPKDPAQNLDLRPKNPMTVKAKTATVKYSALKKKDQVLKSSAILTVKKAKGKVTYKKIKGDKKIVIAKKTGKTTVKKGLKKGTYKVKIKVKAAGNSSYKAGSKTVTAKIVVK